MFIIAAPELDDDGAADVEDALLSVVVGACVVDCAFEAVVVAEPELAWDAALPEEVGAADPWVELEWQTT